MKRKLIFLLLPMLMLVSCNAKNIGEPDSGASGLLPGGSSSGENSGSGNNDILPPNDSNSESNNNETEISEYYDIPSKYISDFSFTKQEKYNTVIYASPTGNGEGSATDPYSLQDALDEAKSNTTIYLLPGVYDVGEGLYSSNSNIYITGENAHITSSRTKGEVVLLTIEKNSQNVVVDGLTFENTSAPNVMGIAMYEGGQKNIVIKNNKFDSLKTTKLADGYGANAILLLGEEITPISNVFIYNNVCTNNVIGWNECISVTANCEHVYVVSNTVTNNTNIGIDFNGNTGDCTAGVKYDQPRMCAAVHNIVSKSISPYAECAGIYSDGANDIYIGYNEVFESHYGFEIGAEELVLGYPSKNIVLEHNKTHDNVECSLRIGGYDSQKSGEVQNVEVMNNEFLETSINIIFTKCDGVSIHNNIMKGIKKYEYELDSKYIKNVVFENNN